MNLASLTSLVLYGAMLASLTSLVLYGAMLAGLTSLVLYRGHVPLNVPDVTKQSTKRVSNRLFNGKAFPGGVPGPKQGR